MTESSINSSDNNIAIIGMASRFPGASNVEQLWQNLCNGVESITFFKNNELDLSISKSIRNNPDYIKARGKIDDADKFDAAFFGISPREASIMDPQHRLFLEVTWEALENAGYVPENYNGLIGLYGGTGLNTYFINNLCSNSTLFDTLGEHQIGIANGPDYLTTRVSYKLNLRGPSISIYTGCSLSLVAVCQACDSLISYQCDIALAGGSFVWCPLKSGYLHQEGEILSADGHCRPFDARATGTVFSNGAGVVVLKRLDEALRDRDYIYAIIRGWAVNNDGSKKVSFTAPSVDGQAEVVAMAQANAGIKPETITYIETHGTGTPVGDPVEIAALSQVFRANISAKGFCAIGSIKSNIGHLDAASGVAGLIKTALMLHYKKIPPTLHFKKPNPNIDFANSPFYVVTKLADWKTDQLPRRAGVTSLGVGGTNAHVVLEEFPFKSSSEVSRSWILLPLSAKTKTALEAATSRLIEYLKQKPTLNLADVGYTLQIGRQSFNHRRIAKCKNIRNAIKALEARDPESVSTAFCKLRHRDVIFMFPGQGSQYINMGLELYKTERAFRDAMDCCAEILLPHLSHDLRDLIYPPEENIDEAAERLQQTAITQPAIFAVSYSLAQLWMSWGVRPQAMVGHSIGEYLAACIAEVFSLENALRLVALRGRLMQELPQGEMLAVPLSEKELKPLLGGNLSLALINGPSMGIVSGEEHDIKNLESLLTEKHVTSRRLHTSHAFHSKMMDTILEPFIKRVKEVKPKKPQIPFLSNVTGTWITSEEAMDPKYWAKQLRQTVRFSDCLHELYKETSRVLLEVGPGRVMSYLALQHPDKSMDNIVCSSMRHPKEQRSDVPFILSTLDKLWMAGVSIDWHKLHEGEVCQRIPLPTYPFERKRYWIEPKEKAKSEDVAGLFSPTEEERLSDAEIAVAEELTATKIDTSKDGTEQALATIWQELLGVDQINDDDNFFDLGGSSMLGAQLFARIEKFFGKKLPLSVLYESPTIKQLAKLIGEREWTEPWSSLVEIQADGAKPPLFLVHGAGGNVLIYRDLAYRLGEDQPVYGLQSQGLDGKQPFFSKVEDMATHYIKEIEAANFHGPYILAGYCLGGSIAWEMAQQLKAQGKNVILVALFETYNFSKIGNMSAHRKGYYYFQKIDFHLRNFLLLKAIDKWKFIKEKANIARGRSRVWWGMLTSAIRKNDNLTQKQSSILADIWKANDRAALAYVPAAYSGRVIQFLPLKEYTHHIGPELRMDKVALSEFVSYTLPVYPGGMMVEPFVKFLVEKLINCINKALEGKSI